MPVPMLVFTATILPQHQPSLSAAITGIILLAAYGIYRLAKWQSRKLAPYDWREQFRRRKASATLIVLLAIAAIIIVWAQELQRTATFLGLIGAGIAIALREPLLGIAGRVAVLFGKMFVIGDRIEINQMKGDVVDIGFFYTRMMEIGNWVQGDQYSGRIIQFSNAQLFGNAVFNYTRHFNFIWDEIMLPITYQSNLGAAVEMVEQAGLRYSQAYLSQARQELAEMQRYFLVAEVEVRPSVFMKVTSNWLELNLRYVVNPKLRRQASNYIFQEIFQQLKSRDDVWIASTTEDLTLHTPQADVVRIRVGEEREKSERKPTPETSPEDEPSAAA